MREGPPSFNVARGTAQSEFCDTKYHYVPFTISNKSPFLNYSVNVFGTNGSLAYYTTNGFVLEFSKNYNGWATFSVSASNSCGTQSVLSEAYIDNCNSIPYGNSSFKTSNTEPISIFKVYPNPASDVVYLDLADINNSPAKNVKIEATLYDMLGFEKQAVKIKDHKATIDVSHLPKGLYILMATINDQTETHLISVE